MDMFDTFFRALLGFAMFVLVTAFAVLTAPVLLPILAILTARREKAESHERGLPPFLRKRERISVSV